jgi:hypothetical protein
MFKFFAIFIFLTLLGYLYDRYKFKYVGDEELNKYDAMKGFLLNNDKKLTSKPIIWIHTKYNVNSREWLSFSSRNTEQLNQPYIFSCVKTIIKHNSNDFYICLIDDKSFNKLIPDFNLDITKLPDPVKKHTRTIALCELLKSYGGMLLPNSTIVTASLKDLYNEGLSNNNIFSAELINRSNTSFDTDLFPSMKIIGCKKGCNEISELINYLKLVNKDDSTNEIEFLGKANKYLFKMSQEHKINIINGKYFGARNKCGKAIYLDDIMNDSFIEFDGNIKGLYIDEDELLKRQKYSWFAKVNENELNEVNNNAAKMLLISLHK